MGQDKGKMSASGAVVALLLWGQLFTVGTANNSTDNADDSCPKPPEIANGYVEHSVRYQCKTYYRLRTDGDGVYTLNSEKQWKNQAIGEKLPECEAGRKPRALGSRPRMGVKGPVLRQASWLECPSVTSL